MHHDLIKRLILFAILLMSFIVSAQPGNPSDPAPIGFIEVLLGTGVVYGGYKAYRKKKAE